MAIGGIVAGPFSIQDNSQPSCAIPCVEKHQRIMKMYQVLFQQGNGGPLKEIRDHKAFGELRQRFPTRIADAIKQIDGGTKIAFVVELQTTKSPIRIKYFITK